LNIRNVVCFNFLSRFRVRVASATGIFHNDDIRAGWREANRMVAYSGGAAKPQFPFS
jgi:hypothetical protein